MRVLLDTRALLWWRDASPSLSATAAAVIGSGENDVLVSVVSLWEIVVKKATGKLRFVDDFEKIVAEEAFALLPIAYPHLRALEALPPHHRDPFGRLLIAQALAERLPIVSGDGAFGRYGVSVLW